MAALGALGCGEGTAGPAPPGARIAFQCRREQDNEEICVVNGDASDQHFVTSDPRKDEFPAWAP